MNPLKFYRLVSAGLLLSNLLLLVFLVTRPAPPSPGRARGIVIRELQFNAAQVQQYDALIKEHRAGISAQEEKILGLKNRLYALLNQPGQAGKDSLVHALGLAQEKTEAIHYEHFRKIRALCSPQQQQNFERLTQKLSLLFMPPRPPKP